MCWQVDHTNFPKINQSRFGARFSGKVANPEDILQFHRKRTVARRGAGAVDDEPDLLTAGAQHTVYSEIQTTLTCIHSGYGSCTSHSPVGFQASPGTVSECDLLFTVGCDQSASLSVLSEKMLAEAVREFVDKQEINAISS